jgi:5-methylcytosine-specific restriction endonuclease McrA
MGGKVPFSTIKPGKFVRRVSAKQRKRMAARKKLREQWWAEGRRTCGICGLPIQDFMDMTNDHILPGSGKSDAPENLQPAHSLCNLLKGSKRNYSQSDCLRDLASYSTVRLRK